MVLVSEFGTGGGGFRLHGDVGEDGFLQTLEDVAVEVGVGVGIGVAVRVGVGVSVREGSFGRETEVREERFTDGHPPSIG